LHSGGVLSLYPLEAGLPPQLRIMDEVEGDIAFRDRWQRFIDELLDEPGMQRPLLRAFTMGLQLKDLERVAQSFHENWERLEGVEFAPSQEPDLAHSPLGQAIEAARIELGPKPTPKVFEHLAELAPHVANLEATARRVREARDPAERDAAEVDLLRLACAFPKIRTDVGKRGVMSAVQAAHEEWVGAARRSYLTAVLPSLRQFVLDYAAERRADGHLGFQDLLVLAVELLRTNTEARRALHDRYRRVLIDEFQDTDPLQVELAALLACEPDDPPVRWTDAKVEPGRLFFVGDPKQSIYRFRRADIVLYERTRRAFGSEHVPLTTNFRSTPAILEWVNNIFEGLFDRDASDGVRQAEWVALQPHEQAERGHPVQLMGGPLEGASADEVPREEADALACAALARPRRGLAGEEGEGGRETVSPTWPSCSRRGQTPRRSNERSRTPEFPFPGRKPVAGVSRHRMCATCRTS